MLKKSLLTTAALCSVAVAVFHIWIIFQGAWAYRTFGAGETLATMVEKGSWIPVFTVIAIVIVFFLAAAYFFSAAGLIPRLPLLRTGMVTVAAVYMLRGVVIFPGLLQLLLGGSFPFGEISLFDISFWSTLISLTIGLIHLAGVYLYWKANWHQGNHNNKVGT